MSLNFPWTLRTIYAILPELFVLEDQRGLQAWAWLPEVTLLSRSLGSTPRPRLPRAHRPYVWLHRKHWMKGCSGPQRRADHRPCFPAASVHDTLLACRA